MTALFVQYAPRGTRLLLASSFLATVPLGYLIVVLPLYLARAGIEPAVIGGFYTASGAMTAVLVAFSGVLADRWGRRRFLIAGTLLPIASYLIFALTTDVPWLVFASFLGGVGLANGAAGALTISSFDALLADNTTEATRTKVFASSQALWSLALAFGSLCAGAPELIHRLYPAMSEIVAYRPPYLAMAVLTLCAGLVIIPIRDDPAVHRARVASGWWPRRSRTAILTYSLAIGFLGFGLGVAVQLMPLWFNLRFGVTETDLGPWYAAAQLASVATLAAVPFMERRLGGPRSVLVALTTSAVCLALIVVAPVFIVAAFLFLIRGFTTNLSWPFHQSLLMTATVPEERATAVGIGFSVWGTTNALGPLAGGALIGAGVFGLPLLVGAAMYVLGGLTFGIGFGRILAKRAADRVLADAAS
ncbi:MAG TPA: MFS transporter [Candidatus Limnocylindrales bacterium]|nr:MFS transporter [Candidatus Limnocylindrales bacterium]